MSANILIVDDTPKNIQMAMNILKSEGYKMFYAKSGKAALKLIDENSFDLILLDIMMPDLDGYAVCKIIKESSKNCKIPIIFLSGKESSNDIELAYECGGIDYVVKPFISIELLTKARNYIKLKKLEEMQSERE
ncbi:hypothetical protein CRV08_03105 [Halarcobacter ebronensis]|uniref:Response regulatory domain-containing protein n=1 Tax=Halarcobacter ebronensis TaxID=1462615 RepID=A0A4V1LRX4_9BACT|nr:response regulator [Halarcobacter ebronensis]RXJ69708.1 hypothetical protein CRV08_03105 [Halarcobacter ebronensis]